MNRTTGRKVARHAMAHYSTAWRHGAALGMAMLGIACIVLFAGEARAQCSARDVLREQLTPKQASASVGVPPTLISSAAAVAAWKTITIGTFADSFALRDALDKAGCGVRDSAEAILARPDFTLGATKTAVELMAVTPKQLGFETDTVPLASIYARAQALGFGLAAAEIAPQLRLQYLDQPAGEFLIVAMPPIRTWEGEPVILSVANGGAGLILTGQDGRADAEIPVMCRFLFVRPNEAARQPTAPGPITSIPLINRSTM